MNERTNGGMDGDGAFTPSVEASINLKINGASYDLRIEPRVSLLDALREYVGLTGTKKGCNQGACGACTVLVDGRRIISCLALAVQYQGREITTIEGLAEDGGLHPLQAAFIEHDAFQCGYCTPGQLCSAIGMFNEFRDGLPSAVTKNMSAATLDFSDEEIKERMSGNLCRCGAYVGICEAVRGFRRGGGAMNNFTYTRAEDAQTAVNLISRNDRAKFLGGGTNLVDLMRENIEQPAALVDVTGLPFDRIDELPDGSISIGAAVRNTAVANHPVIRERYPFLAQAILFGASGQIRNMATVGGNLMQRTRCYYFYDGAANCNKRRPGTGCDAIDGFNRMHAILGASESCIATHPSDMCVALAALDAIVQVEGEGGKREIPFNDFHRLPGDTPHLETDLQPHELITSIQIPAADFAKNSLYRKIRDRASYAFALVSVAAALEVENGAVKNVRLALGGVAHKPWRALAAERVLAGAAVTDEVFGRAAEAELAIARGYAHNSFKIELAKRAIVGVLRELAGEEGRQ